MYKRVSAVLGIATLVVAGCSESPSGPPAVACNSFLLSYSAAGPDTVNTESGVRYIEVEAGTGPVVATESSVATVHFSGYLVDEPGVAFQSSCNSGVPPAGFNVGSGLIAGSGGYYVIEGFSYGVLGMRAGGVRRVIVPTALAYPSEDYPDPNDEFPLEGEDLIFDLHMVDLR